MAILRLELQTSLGVGGFAKLDRRQQVGVLASLREIAPPPVKTMTKAEKRAAFDKQLAVIRGTQD